MLLLPLIVSAYAARRVPGSLLYVWAFPHFDCTHCHGDPTWPCECAYRGAIAPGKGPGRIRAWVQTRFRSIEGD